MAINVLELVPNKNYGFQLTAPNLSVDLLTLDLVTGTVTSTYFNDPEIGQFERAALELFAVVAPPERAPGALNMLNRLLAVAPIDDAALTLSAVVAGNLATLRATINAAPGTILAHVPWSSDGALAWAGGNASGGGGGAVNAVSGTFPITSSGGVTPDIALTVDTAVTDSLEVLPSGLAVNFDPDAGLQSTVGNGLQVKPGLTQGIAFNLAGEVVVQADPNYFDFSFGPGNVTPLDSGVVAGTYGDSVNVPQVQVDVKGRVTSVVNVPISIPPAGVTAVTASSPLASSGGATPDISITAGSSSGDVLTWNGIAWTSAPVPASGVASVTASAPLTSSGGANPDIALTAGTLAGDVLTWNGVAWVASPVPAGSTVSLLNDVFVAQNGSDITGDGSASKPFATVTAAMASITTAASNNRFAIRLSAGDYAEPGAISLKPDVFIVGDGWENTSITTTGVLLDATWSGAVGAFSGFYDVAINGPTTINFVPSTNADGRFNAVNTRFEDDLTVTAFSNSNIIGIVRCVTAGGVVATFNGGDVFSFGTLYQGPINYGDSATAARTYITSMNDTFNGPVTGVNGGATAPGDFVVLMLGSSLGSEPGNPNAREDATFTGAVILRATSNFVPDSAHLILSGGATLEQWSFATGVGYEPAVPGNWLVPPTEVSGALDELAARAASAGTVTAVTASGVLSSSGGATPDITLTGVVPVANGGTNASTFNAYGVVVADATGTTLVDVLGGASGEVLTWNGTQWSAAAIPPPGGVTSVTASAPLASSGGATPDISLTAGTNPNDVLTWNGAAWTSAAPTGGLVNWTENTTTYSGRVINNFTALNAATDVDAALVAKGNGATVAQIADGTAAGGDNRGQYATDFQKSRGAATQVASGNYSAIVGGSLNTASGEGSVVGGVNNVGSGIYAVALGNAVNATNAYAVAIGINSTASGTQAVAIGASNTASATNSLAMRSGAATADTAVAIGGTASGNWSTSVGGLGGTASGTGAGVFAGQNNTAAGFWAGILAGYANVAPSAYEVGLGYQSHDFGGSDATNYVATDVAVGYGNGGSGNAFTFLKNGSLALGRGTAKPKDQLDVAGNARMTGAIVQDGFTSGAAITAGQVCYLAADGKVYAAQSNSTTTSTVVGVAVETVVAADLPIALATFNKTGGFSGLTTGTEYFLSSTSAGAVVDYATLSAVSGVQIVSLGYARSATEIQLNIQRRGVTP